MSSDSPSGAPASFLPGHLLCGGLVLGWLQGYAVWNALAHRLGPAVAWVPLGAALLCVLGFLIVVVIRRRLFHFGGARWAMLAAVPALIALGLSLPDASLPAKQIHVPEYVLLGLAARLVLCRSLPPGVRSWGAGVAVILYAFHDELLQGLHPDRTFGLDELGSDILAGLAALLAVRALAPEPLTGPDRTALRALAPLVWVPAGAVLLILPLPAFRDQLPPFWLLLPLLAGGAVWFSVPASSLAGLPSPVRRWADQITLLALLLAPYPVLPHVAPLVFH